MLFLAIPRWKLCGCATILNPRRTIHDYDGNRDFQYKLYVSTIPLSKENMRTTCSILSVLWSISWASRALPLDQHDPKSTTGSPQWAEDLEDRRASTHA
jgi:hypothetical protein